MQAGGMALGGVWEGEDELSLGPLAVVWSSGVGLSAARVCGGHAWSLAFAGGAMGSGVQGMLEWVGGVGPSSQAVMEWS